MRSRWMRTALFIGAPLIATTLCTLESLRGPIDINVTSESVTLGDIVRHVIVTGVLQPTTTVDIGSQVSGTIAEVDADFNAVVRTGQVLLRLDGSELQAALDEARSTLTQARADLAAARNTADLAASTLNRDERLTAQNMIAEMDLDEARTAMTQADADVQAASARVDEAVANVRNANVSLQQTVIRSPVDGVVLSRNVTAGETVAAAQSAPVLFRIATDLRGMELIADLDESDVASITIGETARFRVDAYQNENFDGHVTEIRLDAVRDQLGPDGATPRPDASEDGPSVVTYPVIITVDNAEQQLRPGMTAIVRLDGARRNRATRIPNAALSFVPSPRVLAATQQKTPGPPPLPTTNTDSGNARVWAYDGTEFTPIMIRTGLADEHWTELVSGPLEPGATLVTNAAIGGDADPASN
jgi:HlyD family secretion protein